MRISENRALALIVCVICVLTSVFVLGGIKLKGEYEDTVYEFVDGGDVRHNLEAYLDRCADYATELADEAVQYLDPADDADKVRELAAALSAQNGPGGDRYDNYIILTAAVENLYSTLQLVDKSDEPAIKLAYGDYKSACDLIKRDDYYEDAAAFNKKVNGFPAGIVAAIWGIDKADSFGQ